MAIEVQRTVLMDRNQVVVVILLVAILVALIYLVMSRTNVIHLERDENGRLTDIITT